MDRKILTAKFKKAKECTKKNEAECNTVFAIKDAYIAMGHYDVVVFNHVSRNEEQVLNVGERCFLPFDEASIAEAVGTSVYRFLVMINILHKDSVEKNIKETAQEFVSQLESYGSKGNVYNLYRSLDNCDIACIIDSDDYPGTLELVRKCADSIETPTVYFFTVPMLNARVLDETKIINADIETEVPDTALLVRTTVKEHRKIGELLSEEKLLKGLRKTSKYIMFGANDIVVDMGCYSAYKVITYYRNVMNYIADYLAVLYSAEVEIMKKKS
ncbi:MAG: hypothetical protein IKZ82_12655 [Clostridia bacterium]|nr:hypothetical protein [Clostridia bacterium]